MQATYLLGIVMFADYELIARLGFLISRFLILLKFG
jgi:hypothetical protein